MMSADRSPLISVVIPSYNQGEYLDDCIQSVLGQAYPSLELIVMDGGSSDNSLDVIRKHERSIAFWRSERDGGQSAAINEGFRKSRGDILCWLNSDDMHLPGTLREVALGLGQSLAEPALMYGASIVIREPGASQTDHLVALPAASRPFDRTLLSHNAYILQPSAFWTRKLWEAAGELRIDQHYAFDWEWFIRASEHATFMYVRKFFSVYRQHALHKSGQHSPKRREELQDIIKAHAPAYWRGIYAELNQTYDEVRRRQEQLESIRLPKRKRLLPLFFPRLARQLKSHEDLYSALEMLA